MKSYVNQIYSLHNLLYSFFIYYLLCYSCNQTIFKNLPPKEKVNFYYKISMREEFKFPHLCYDTFTFLFKTNI
jgi:hypothetical protein